MADLFELERFIKAQDGGMDAVRAELRSGRKSGHWMWFIFPQIKGLGSSGTANYYAISCRAEAEAYLSHPVLGLRLVDCTELVNLVERRSAVDIFGYPDWLKFRSSMTLFDMLNPGTSPFSKALDKYFDGVPDRRTLSLLERAPNSRRVLTDSREDLEAYRHKPRGLLCELTVMPHR